MNCILILQPALTIHPRPPDPSSTAWSPCPVPDQSPAPGAPARPADVVPPHPSVDVSSDLQRATHIEELASIKSLIPKLQLAITFEVLHRLEMAEKSRPL
jgi:hypothetical protein